MDNEEASEVAENEEGRKNGLRRTLRQRRVTEAPAPPPIPGWFLKHNVRLRKDRGDAGSQGPGGHDIECVDVETGHTLFRVPYGARDAEDASETASKRETGQTKDQETGTGQKLTNTLESDFFGHKNGFELPKAGDPEEDLPLGFRSPKASVTALRTEPLTWSMLAAETFARAAFSLSGQTPSSFAATRTDLFLHCPDGESHTQMDDFVLGLASTLEADVIRLDANDLAELLDDYVGQGSDSLGSFSTLAYDVFDGYISNKPSPAEDMENEEEEEDDEDEPELSDSRDISDALGGRLEELRKVLSDRRSDLNRMMRKATIDVSSFTIPMGAMAGRPQPRASSVSNFVQWDDARLTAILDSLLDAPQTKRAGLSESSTSTQNPQENDATGDAHASPIFNSWSERPGAWLRYAASALVDLLKANKSTGQTLTKLRFEDAQQLSHDQIPEGTKAPRIIVHLRDSKDICRSKLGDAIVNRLVKVVQKRRRAGSEILVVGTTSQDIQGSIESLTQPDNSPLHGIIVPPLFKSSGSDRSMMQDSSVHSITAKTETRGYSRILEINSRHIGSMLRRLQSDLREHEVFSLPQDQTLVPGTPVLSEQVLPLDVIQRLVLTAIGLSQSYARADTVQPMHIALAAAIHAQADQVVRSWSASRVQEQMNNMDIAMGKSGHKAEMGQAAMDNLKKICDPHETKLLTGVVNPHNIKTGFNDVHVPPETIEALKTLTTLSLLRPDAFKYGVLASDSLSGLMLYGPPGTGKTLLAKAVAKESGASVLEISGAQIYEKYVGEGEKMVRAVFSLAKKLSPCVVFVDEADAIFGSRNSAGNRNTHREIINQFLREWDGMDAHGVFVMVASNRPFDCDDAVLRRLPRRLLVDLPTAKDRQSILGIHLRDEALDAAVSLQALAERTPLYSGSDLKNVCVAAALAVVREENELAASRQGDDGFKLPDKRVLHQRHFDKAVQEISASISEDMSSLTAIRKFDEQYGDRRGRKKRSSYGFGAQDGKVDENAARVRQGS